MTVVARRAQAVVLVTALVALLAATALSPLALGLFSGASEDWEDLSTIGEAYGGISAVLASLALAGVGVSLLIQARQFRVEQLATIRSFQFRLYDLIREDPETYWPALGGPAELSSDLEVRRRTFHVQLFQYFGVGFDVGVLAAPVLRTELLPDFFSYDANRRYWEDTRKIWLDAQPTGRQAKFVKLVEEEYQRAVAGGPATPTPVPGRGRRLAASERPKSRRGRLAWLGVGLCGGLALSLGGRLARRMMTSRHSRGA